MQKKECQESTWLCHEKNVLEPRVPCLSSKDESKEESLDSSLDSYPSVEDARTTKEQANEKQTRFSSIKMKRNLSSFPPSQ